MTAADLEALNRRQQMPMPGWDVPRDYYAPDEEPERYLLVVDTWSGTVMKRYLASAPEAYEAAQCFASDGNALAGEIRYTVERSDEP
jgi:hypothetical protein